MSAFLSAPTPATLHACYLAELRSERRSETMLGGRWASEAEFTGRFQSGVTMLSVVQAAETENEVLGLVGIDRLNLTQESASLFYARYRDSLLFWDGLSIAVQKAFLTVPVRRLFVEVPAFIADVASMLPGHATLDLVLRDYKFHEGRHHDLSVWSIWREAR
jgi:hypothetical protein